MSGLGEVVIVLGTVPSVTVGTVIENVAAVSEKNEHRNRKNSRKASYLPIFFTFGSNLCCSLRYFIWRFKYNIYLNRAYSRNLCSWCF